MAQTFDVREPVLVAQPEPQRPDEKLGQLVQDLFANTCVGVRCVGMSCAPTEDVKRANDVNANERTCIGVGGN